MRHLIRVQASDCSRFFDINFVSSTLYLSISFCIVFFLNYNFIFIDFTVQHYCCLICKTVIFILFLCTHINLLKLLIPEKLTGNCSKTTVIFFLIITILISTSFMIYVNYQYYSYNDDNVIQP